MNLEAWKKMTNEMSVLWDIDDCHEAVVYITNFSASKVREKKCKQHLGEDVGTQEK